MRTTRAANIDAGANPAGRTWWTALAQEGGQAIIVFTLGLSAFLGLAAMTVDVGFYVKDRASLQASADAAALAGVSQLPGSTSNADAVARQTALNNGLGVSGDSVTVTFSTTYATNDTITVTGGRSVPFVFGKVLKLVSTPDSVKAVAVTGVPSSVTGTIPWFVNNDALVAYGQLASLQPANGGNGGQFNFVSITPPNGQTYSDAMANGVSSPILWNTNYPTNTFDGSSVSAQTAAALNARISAAPNETWQTFTPGSPRVVFAPVLNGGAPNAPAPVKAISFKAFFLDHVDLENSTIWIRPVKANVVVGGSIGAGIPDYGVHVIKLIQ